MVLFLVEIICKKEGQERWHMFLLVKELDMN